MFALQATDADDGENGEIRFSLTYITQDRENTGEGPMPNNPLDIEPRTGAISVATSLDEYAGRVLFYQVEATDRNGDGLSSYLRLSVCSLDLHHPLVSIFLSLLCFQVHVLGDENQVALVLATRTEELVNQSANISRFVIPTSWIKVLAFVTSLTDCALYCRTVSDISGMDVWVKSVEPHVEGDAINSAV